MELAHPTECESNQVWRRLFLTFALVSAIAAIPAFADVPDLTSSMVSLCNPNASRWTASQPYARAATSIGVCDGRLYTSGGDWDDNLGPCPIFAIDPYSGSYVREYESGTESIDYFRYGSDGSLYAPSVDPREGHANVCSVARRKPDGTWTKLNAPNRWIRYSSSENAAYGTHNWDFAIWKGKIFTAGYGLGVGTEMATTTLSDATPQINDANRVYKSSTGSGTFEQSRRFYAFLPFEEDIFCYPLTYSGTGVTTTWGANYPIGQYAYEEWRYNESTGRFVCQTNAFSNVTPGLTHDDLALRDPSYATMQIQLWHPTAFKGRVLYIAGVPGMTTLPFVLYTAENVNHSVRATRVDLGSGVFPFDVFVRGDVVTVLAAQYDSAVQKVVNSVWESTDGVSFTKKFTFAGVQYANAIAYCDGSYYVSMGAREVVRFAWTFSGTDEVGKIYRIRDPAYADAIQVVAENAEVSVPEGGSAVARFKLAAQPSAPVTASVRATGGVPAVTTAVASVTFTPQDWNSWHDVALSVAEDDLEKVSSGSLVCGAGNPASLVPVSIKVTPVNNDFRVADTPPAGIVDITVPNGDFTATSSVSINTNNPFNDDPSGTNIANRLLVQSNRVTITYDFGNPATVNGYGIYNFVPSGYSPAERAPHTWKFQASNDGKNWTTLDERKLESGWTGGEYRYYACTNTTEYTMYRLAVTDNNGNEYTQFARMEMYGTGTSLVPLTRTSTGAVYTNSTSHASYGAAGAFDNNRNDTNGRWLASKADHMYVVWKFNEATAVNTLRVWNGSDSGGGTSSAARSPKAWTFYGSNDGETWTALDARTGEPDWSASGEDRFYSFDNDTAYEYYKYDCTELCGTSATYLQLWELEFYYIEGGSGTGGGDNPGGGDDPGPGGEEEGEVLVYEGFHSADYSFAGTYSTNAPVLKGTNPTAQNVGFDGNNAWSTGTAVPRLISGSLTVGASFANDETNGTGRVVMQNSGTEAKGRGIHRKFSAALPTGGTIYYRFLMKLNAATNNYLSVLQSGGYWAGGLVKSAFNGGTDAMKSLTTDGIWMGYKKTGAAEISLFARIGETDYLLPYNTSNTSPLLSTWSTYMFIAKIEIGAGAGGKDRVSIAAQPIAAGAFSDTWEWNVTNVEANIVSGGTPVSYIAFAGQYQTGGYEVAIDQFKIATSLDKVCNHDPWPQSVDAPAPVFGGDGVPAPSFGVDKASGNPVFTFSIGNAVKGARYRIYKTESLSEPFEPVGDVIEATADGLLDFAVPTADKPSCFFKVVVE